MKRIFLMVLDSVGIGEMPDAKNYGDEGSNTLKACAGSVHYSMPNLERLGIGAIDGVRDWYPEKGKYAAGYSGAVGRLAEASMGKDTTTGHWEIAGLISETPMPLFPHGFPKELLEEFEKRTGRGILCNRPYSGTDAIRDFGEEHMKTGALIVYTSADSVFQVAAHEAVVPVEELYEICETARELCAGPYGVGRVIARPFEGTPGNFRRTERRHDFSLVPPGDTMMDVLLAHGKDVLAVGKINDIFAGKGIGEFVRTSGNADGIDKTIEYMKREFEGLCFINLVDYDMLYGHRNDVDGYAKALSYFDRRIPQLLALLGKEDILMITADHGCDPSTVSTDHSREYVPLVMAGNPVKAGANIGTRNTFADIGATILDYFGLKGKISGESFLKKIM
ncbi:MAG: phosphopentomutase [Lachnospiraceae bacterium]|nr:phosphopentomutase [Lachnospiraceae bacterium]